MLEEIEVESSVWVGEKKIVLPSDSDAQKDRGWRLARVIAVGNGHRLETDQVVPMFFCPGDVVYIERFTGRALRLQNREYLIVNQIDVLMRAPDVPDLMALPELVSSPAS